MLEDSDGVNDGLFEDTVSTVSSEAVRNVRKFQFGFFQCKAENGIISSVRSIYR
jgi:hypothetical protein